MNKPTNVEDYIDSFDKSCQEKLLLIRTLIKTIAPTSVESISYGMPSYKLNGKPFVYFAGYKNHIGLYAMPTTNQAFKNELKSYKQGKNSIQFPINETLPEKLIIKLIKFRVKIIFEKSVSHK